MAIPSLIKLVTRIYLQVMLTAVIILTDYFSIYRITFSKMTL